MFHKIVMELLRKWHHWRKSHHGLVLYLTPSTLMLPHSSCESWTAEACDAVFGCHLLLQSCVYYRATTSIYILWSLIIFPWNLMIDVFHSGGIAWIDAKLCQHSVAGPFPQTVYLVRSVHKPSSWQPGLYWSKVRRACSAGNRWFRPPFCGQGSDHVLYASPDRERYT